MDDGIAENFQGRGVCYLPDHDTHFLYGTEDGKDVAYIRKSDETIWTKCRESAPEGEP